MRKVVLVVVCALLACTGALAEEIKVGGGGAAINSVIRPMRQPFLAASHITLVSVQSTPKDGLIALLKGEVDAAAAAVPLESMVNGAEKDGMKVDTSRLQQTVIGTNKTVVFIHKDNPVTSLSKDQLKGIFTGKILNWKDVGGENKDIIVVWGSQSPGQNALFSQNILDKEAVTKDALQATDYAGIKEAVASNQEAIGIDPLGLADGTVKAIKTVPELSSPVIIVTVGKPSPNVQKLIDFIKGDGKKDTSSNSFIWPGWRRGREQHVLTLSVGLDHGPDGSTLPAPCATR